ncbi:simple sugar transport system ATP-binding protein [Amycolatopsis lexingtonensis]|uniref:Simple sugar transport system ATP-binding protein n=1 Tax=Amycolatopsis lexingtonensis TaxID=218822 RepID=A0ABR9HY48_9PSEU|nr:sugar ABC transporter ATP-binding protein [Amycolatopsis lexingtonensis]MBE1495858.1 simple sugar transport system ATP-binding protein [Amycolatopsis lexingtonensis]
MGTVPVVEARQVVKRYGATVALDHADLTVLTGQTHALVGRNGAGKSTLVSILTGLTEPDSGSLLVNGEPVPGLSDRDKWRALVACVYQKSTIIPHLSVAENLFLNRQETRRGFVRWSAVRRAATELLERWSVDVDVRRPAGELGVEQRQFVEIARALSFGARFVILDEPTAQLDGGAITRLFGHLAELQRQGVTFLFISHHLQEVYEICDTVTVFRDARHVLTAPVAGLPKLDLVAAMTGEDATLSAERASSVRPGAPPVLRVRDLSLDPGYEGVSFDVAPGEIVGLAGAGGSGKTEVAETLTGLRTADSGTIAVGERRPRPGDVPAALAAGIGFVPEDRHRQGLVPEMSVADNTTLSVLDRLGPGIFVRSALRDRLAGTMITRLAVKTPGPELAVSALSGGNQQKVVLARALAGDPRVLVLITPTAGVDVRSKEFLLGKVAEAAAAGTAVLIASDELDDLRLCDRVLVMVHGRLTAELPAGWQDREVVAAVEGVDLDAG